MPRQSNSPAISQTSVSGGQRSKSASQVMLSRSAIWPLRIKPGHCPFVSARAGHLMFDTEGCESGRIGRSRKPLCPQGHRGFESHSLRGVGALLGTAGRGLFRVRSDRSPNPGDEPLARRRVPVVIGAEALAEHPLLHLDPARRFMLGRVVLVTGIAGFLVAFHLHSLAMPGPGRVYVAVGVALICRGEPRGCRSGSGTDRRTRPSGAPRPRHLDALPGPRCTARTD